MTVQTRIINGRKLSRANLKTTCPAERRQEMKTNDQSQQETDAWPYK